MIAVSPKQADHNYLRRSDRQGRGEVGATTGGGFAICCDAGGVAGALVGGAGVGGGVTPPPAQKMLRWVNPIFPRQM